MKTFRKIIVGLLVVIAILVIVAYVLPKSYNVEKSVYIKSDKMVIYDLVSYLEKWDLWEVWNKQMDSTLTYTLTGKDGEAGVVRSWTGKKLGQGDLGITGLKPGQEVDYSLAFQNGKMKSTGKFLIEPEGDSCKVTWTNTGDLGYNPIGRYMGLFMSKMLGPDFEKGLSNLKKIAEERASWPRIEEKAIPEQTVLFVKDSAGMADYKKILGKAYGELYTFVKSKGLKQTGPPFVVYLRWDSVTQFSVMDIGVPVEMAEKGAGRIRVEKTPAQNAVIAYYFGPYSKIGKVYYILDQYVRESGKQPIGGPWEIYVTDPMTEKDSTKLETDILFPVK